MRSPSEYSTRVGIPDPPKAAGALADTAAPRVSTPGHRFGSLAGRSASRMGNVTGSFPDGVASPNSSRATIAPSS